VRAEPLVAGRCVMLDLAHTTLSLEVCFGLRTFPGDSGARGVGTRRAGGHNFPLIRARPRAIPRVQIHHRCSYDARAGGLVPAILGGLYSNRVGSPVRKVPSHSMV
jgi:hypothetical protein